MALKLRSHQIAAVRAMKNGCILCGDVGSGKSITALAYYYLQNGGSEKTLFGGDYIPMRNPPRDLYIITTARKRDEMEWEEELLPFLISTHPELSMYNHRVVIDSWNNIKKYRKAYGAFFIFDEQRVVGSGAWVKSFYDIARKNKWILLSATPGDKWEDYIPVFIANGFYRTKTEFQRRHIVYNPRVKFPKVDRYLDTAHLERLKKSILIDMEFQRDTVQHHEDIFVDYDVPLYRECTKRRWNPYTDEPMRNASELCQVWRRIVNTDQSRQQAILEIFEDHPKMIVFYNFNYELDILRELFHEDNVAEWNGHKHEPIPDADSWVYLVQYNSGAEGWNCILTDTIVFYSQNYSWRIMHQAAGRIDRLNTPFKDLYYYHIRSRSSIDLAISRALKAKKEFNERTFMKQYDFKEVV